MTQNSDQSGQTPNTDSAANSADTTQGALADQRLVEMEQLLAGPFCGQLMAGFGAELIKCEPPGAGDSMRQWGREKTHSKSLWWPVVARNKKCVILNLHTAERQADAITPCPSARVTGYGQTDMYASRTVESTAPISLFNNKLSHAS